VFTARYALSPYIKQVGFVFKGLIRQPVGYLTQRVVYPGRLKRKLSGTDVCRAVDAVRQVARDNQSRPALMTYAFCGYLHEGFPWFFLVKWYSRFNAHTEHGPLSPSGTATPPECVPTVAWLQCATLPLWFQTPVIHEADYASLEQQGYVFLRTNIYYAQVDVFNVDWIALS
jgi:hypothetical protein